MRDQRLGHPVARGEVTAWRPGRDVLVDVDRARILDAIVGCAVDGGLEALTLDRVVATAAVSHNTFASRFRCLEEACLAAMRTLTASAYHATVAAQDRAPSWRQGVRAGIAAALDYLGEEPSRARFLCEEAPKLGRPAWVHHEQTARRYAERLRILRERRGGAAPLPAVCYEVMIGAMYAVLRRASAQDRLPTVDEMVASVAALGVPLQPPLALVG
jgi:AcrR family transcriptional regulator